MHMIIFSHTTISINISENQHVHILYLSPVKSVHLFMHQSQHPPSFVL